MSRDQDFSSSGLVEKVTLFCFILIFGSLFNCYSHHCSHGDFGLQHKESPQVSLLYILSRRRSVEPPKHLFSCHFCCLTSNGSTFTAVFSPSHQSTDRYKPVGFFLGFDSFNHILLSDYRKSS